MKRSLSRLLLLPAAALGLASTLHAESSSLALHPQGYLDQHGLSVLVFSSEYDGLFFDEKTAGIQLVHHGVRTATGGAVRINPTPEQWDPIPKVVGRTVDKETNAITVLLRYEEYGFDSRLVVSPAPGGFSIAAHLDKPVPEKLEGRAGLNLEFVPASYFGRTYLADGAPGLFPLHPAGPVGVRPAATRLRQFAGHETFDDHGRGEYLEVEPIATGKTLVLAPDSPDRHVTIAATAGGPLQLLDGRNVAQNGWFVVRSLLPAKATGKVAEWLVTPHLVPGWKRAPIVGFSQAGYLPKQKKVAVVELDPTDTPLATASVVEVRPDGTSVERLAARVEPWGRWMRQAYATFDFSSIETPGLYFLRYGDQRTETFPIGPDVYAKLWHPTLDVFFPVQMDHMLVNEAYRVWHGAPHLDDARQAPVNHQHFDGYSMGPTTETKYAPGERIPGLDMGGWFDAGDFDIQSGSHAQSVLSMVEAWELFRPTRDQTLVDQAARFVDIHHPDGRPDLLQQVQHGILALVAQHRAFGRAIRGIVDGRLHQYHHLGDASTQTDNLVYDPSLAPGQRTPERSGTPDDRWAFTARTPATNLMSVAALAAASRVLRGHDDALAEECLAHARRAWDEEKNAAPTQDKSWESRFRAGAEMSAALQLFITTKDKAYGDRYQALLWPALDAAPQFSMGDALRARPHFDAAFGKRLEPYVAKYAAGLATLAKQNPWGVPVGMGGWAGNGGVMGHAITAWHAHRAYPALVSAGHAYAGLEYILGRHPYSNVSFVSAVGARSKRHAYGNNRADFGFIAGGVVPGVLVLKPDLPEHQEEWPFLWGENEYTIGAAASWLLLASMAGAGAIAP
jgi:hypothetical protein